MFSEHSYEKEYDHSEPHSQNRLCEAFLLLMLAAHQSHSLNSTHLCRHNSCYLEMTLALNGQIKKPSSLKDFKDESYKLRVTTLIHRYLAVSASLSTDLSSIPLRCNGRAQYSLVPTHSVYGSKTGSEFLP